MTNQILNKAIKALKIYLLSAAFCGVKVSYGQSHPDSVKQQHLSYLMKTLQVDFTTAVKVGAVEMKFRELYNSETGEKRVLGRDQQKRIEQLMLAKTKQLGEILTPVQLMKVVPLSSVTTNRDSVNKLLRAQYFAQKLNIDFVKAQTLSEIFVLYQRTIKRIVTTADVTAKIKQIRVDSLIARTNHELALLLTPAQTTLLIPDRRAAGMLPSWSSHIFIAAQDTFQRKSRQLMAQKDLSDENKRSKMAELIKNHDNSINSLVQ